MGPLLPSKKKKRRSLYPVLLHEEDATKKAAYVNVTILDSTDAVYNMVHSKVSETHKNWVGPKKFKDMVAHNVAKTASTKVPKRLLVQKLSSKIPKMLMYQMYHKMGMQLAAQTVYREDKYCVIQIQVQHVDTKRLLATAKEEMRNTSSKETTDADGDISTITTATTEAKQEEEDDDSVATAVLDEWIEEQKKLREEEQSSPFVTEAQNNNAAEDEVEEKWNFSNWREVLVMILAWILTKLMPVTITKDLEENQLPAIIQSQISANMKEMLDKKLESKHMKADTAVLHEDQQARYFYAQLQKIRSDPTAEGGEELTDLSEQQRVSMASTISSVSSK